MSRAHTWHKHALGRALPAHVQSAQLIFFYDGDLQVSVGIITDTTHHHRATHAHSSSPPCPVPDYAAGYCDHHARVGILSCRRRRWYVSLTQSPQRRLKTMCLRMARHRRRTRRPARLVPRTDGKAAHAQGCTVSTQRAHMCPRRLHRVPVCATAPRMAGGESGTVRLIG